LSKGLRNREIRIEAAGLKDNAYLSEQFVPGFGGIDPQNLDAAGVSGHEPLEDLDGGRLARTIGTQEPQNLPSLDLEVHATESPGLSIPLGQSRDLHDGVAG
jgi:hypothetical protein